MCSPNKEYAMENLINSFPPIIIDIATHTPLWFTLGRTRVGWTAGYVDEEGYTYELLTGNGNTPLSSCEDLLGNFRLINLINAPAIKVDELTGDVG